MVISLAKPVIIDIKGIVFITSARKAKHAYTFIQRSKRYIQIADRHLEISRALNTIAPIMDSSGMGGLHDAFSTVGREYNNVGQAYKEKAIFFWRQGNYILEDFGDSIVLNSSPSPRLQELTGMQHEAINSDVGYAMWFNLTRRN